MASTSPATRPPRRGIAGLTKALANEWAARGVNVNAIAPGYIATDNTQALRDDPDRDRAILERIPAGRWGKPADLAGATVFLASAASDYVNGDRPAGRRRLARPVTSSSVLDRLGAFGVVPVVVIEDTASATSLGSALAAGGPALCGGHPAYGRCDAVAAHPCRGPRRPRGCRPATG